jgi:DNA-binding CsgD family transcriptional regulator
VNIDQEPGLTRREFQILKFVAQGYSAKEAAQEIGIAPRTVEGHIDTIKLKLRARNRAHMITNAIAARILTITDRTDGNAAALPGVMAATDVFAYFG